MSKFWRTVFPELFIIQSFWKSLPWPDRRFVFKEHNFEVKIPTRWSIKDDPKFIVAARRPKGGTIAVMVLPQPKVARVDEPSVMKALRERLIGKGFEVIRENTNPFKEQCAYRCTTRRIRNDKTMYVDSVRFVTGDFFYLLEVVTTNKDPIDDAELQKVLNSFNFLATP